MLSISSFAPCKIDVGVTVVPLTLAITVALALMVMLRHDTIWPVVA
jgi:hypothetical protein